MKIGLFLVGNKGQKVLENLIEVINIDFVLSYNDKKTIDDSFYLMKGMCLAKKIRFFEGKNVSDEIYSEVDKIFVIGWQFFLKKHLNKLIIIHDSLLPEYKGWSPTVQYLINGCDYLAATAFAPTNVMDTGDIYAQIKKNIKYPIKIESAINIVGEMYVEIIKKIIIENPEPVPMEGKESFCVWRDDLDYFIDWNDDANKIKRFIDAVGYPYSGAKFIYDNKTIIVEDAEVIDDIKIIDREKHIGKFWSFNGEQPIIICGNGLLKINQTKCDIKFSKLKTRL
jgi:methionyl-tRNA formyltransferase